MFNAQEAIDYFKLTPEYKRFESVSEDQITADLFDAYEDIHSLYPNVKISPRMIVKQMLFKKESDESGFGSAQKHGLTSRKINDASITFSGSYNLYDPYVWEMIKAQMDTHLEGGFGHLV